MASNQPFPWDDVTPENIQLTLYEVPPTTIFTLPADYHVQFRQELQRLQPATPPMEGAYWVQQRGHTRKAVTRRSKNLQSLLADAPSEPTQVKPDVLTLIQDSLLELHKVLYEEAVKSYLIRTLTDDQGRATDVEHRDQTYQPILPVLHDAKTILTATNTPILTLPIYAPHEDSRHTAARAPQTTSSPAEPHDTQHDAAADATQIQHNAAAEAAQGHRQQHQHSTHLRDFLTPANTFQHTGARAKQPPLDQQLRIQDALLSDPEDDYQRFQADIQRNAASTRTERPRNGHTVNFAADNTTSVLSSQLRETLRVRRSNSRETTSPITNPVNPMFITPDYISRVKLPPFSGDPADWPNFYDQFEALVDSNPYLPTINKLEIVHRALTGRAAKLVKQFPFRAQNYDLVIAALQQRFGRPRLIMQDLHAKIRDHPMVSERDMDSFQDFGHLITMYYNETISMSQRIGVDPLASIFQIEEKLSASCLIAWQKVQSRLHRQFNNEPPPKIYFQSLIAFVNDYIDQRLTVRAIRGQDTSRPQRSSAHQRYTGRNNFNRRTFLSEVEDTDAGGNDELSDSDDETPPPVKTLTNFSTSVHQQPKQTNQRPPPKCCFCEGPHKSGDCEIDKGTPEECYAIVIKNRLCLNCLKPGHRNRVCRNPPCNINNCGRKHHRFLHRPNTEEQRPKPDEPATQQ